MVCDFMGHEEKIHDSYYRMSSDVQHITQMSGLLKATAKGIHDKPNGSKSLREFVQKLSNPTDDPADLATDEPEIYQQMIQQVYQQMIQQVCQ